MLSSSSGRLIISGMLAACYALLTLLLPVASYGQIQFRYAEMLTLLVFYNKRTLPGLTLGCLIANFWSPFGIFDIIFGTLATFIALWLMTRTKNRLLASLMPALVNGPIIAAEIAWLSGTPETFFITALYIALSEIIIVSVIGNLVFSALEKNKHFIEAVRTF